MTQTHPLKWYERCQLELGVRWQLVPSRDLTWRTWAWSPEFGLTLPGQEITYRTQLPESSSVGVDTLSVGEAPDRKFYSYVFWVHGALRLLGLDVGAGLFWRQQKPPSKE